MAMLVLPDVFERTWGIPSQPFWPQATQRVREQVPDFCFMAEVYWDLEWTLQQQGFDYTYDKRLYDRLRDGHARPVREHLLRGAGLPEQDGPLSGEPRRAAGGGDFRRRESMKPRRSSRSCPLACGSSTRGSSRGGRNASRRISVAARANPSTRSCSSSTSGCWPCCASRWCATASGNCSNACRPGKATGPGIASWPSPGKVPDGRAAAGGGELCTQPEPVLRPASV